MEYPELLASDLFLMHLLASRPVYLFLALSICNIRIFSRLKFSLCGSVLGLFLPCCVISILSHLKYL